MGELQTLLETHPKARIIVNDQYRHSVALAELRALLRELEPGSPVNQITVTFTKDRRREIDDGRFVDRTYGVLGYEWLHMLAVLREIVPAHLMNQYLSADPLLSDLYPTYDERLFVAGLSERTTVEDDQHRIHLELVSSITGPLIPVAAEPEVSDSWRRNPPCSRRQAPACHRPRRSDTVRLASRTSYCARWMATRPQSAPPHRRSQRPRDPRSDNRRFPDAYFHS